MLPPDNGCLLGKRVADAGQTGFGRVFDRRPAARAGGAGTRDDQRPAWSAQTTVIAGEWMIAVWAHAGKQGFDSRDQRAPRLHGGYRTRMSTGLEDRPPPNLWPSRGYTLTMNVLQHEFEMATDGHGHVYDLTDEITIWLGSIEASNGQLTVFTPGSTAAVTTIEFEPGAVRDLVEALEAIAPSNRSYHHDLRWGDGNGFSHLRAALMGPSLTVPVAGGSCIVGTWQQIVLVECDLAPRRRRIVLSFVGDFRGGA